MHAIRNARAHQSRMLNRAVRTTDAHAFFNLLTDVLTLDPVEVQLPMHRERLLPPTETLAMFLAQVLSADRSCQHAVNRFIAGRVAGGLSACSTATGAYCRARKRLPEQMVHHLVRHTGRAMAASMPATWTWRGQPVRLVDGSTVSMPDTAENQALYPQPRTQQPGLGFPLCRVLVLMCLGSGALLDAATSPYHGKGNDEQTLLRGLLDNLNTGEILVGDALFASYFLLAELRRRGVDGVFEQHGARRRSTDFRRGRHLGPRDHLIEIHKPTQRPAWMTSSQFDAMPDTLTVRELRTGGKTLVTTLLCPKKTSKADLKSLYRQRWHVELDLRVLKTTLGMERLSCKTPAMATKELWVYLLAYNLIRRMMAQAAQRAHVSPRCLSFKHTLQLWIAWHQQGIDPDDDQNVTVLMALIAQRRVGNRPGRIEPRAVKRRPKPYPLLTKPRAVAREAVRAHGHAKKLK